MTTRIDLPLVVCWLLVLSLGLVMVASSSVALGNSFLLKHGFFCVLSLLAFALLLVIPTSWIMSVHKTAWLVAVVICGLVLLPGIGYEINGARRWIRIGGFSLHAAEIAKLCLLIYLAGYLTRFGHLLAQEPVVLVRPLVMVGLVCVLLLAEPDFGSVVVLGVTVCGLLFVSGAKLRHFALIALVCLVIIAVLAVVQPYRLERLVSYRDPWAVAFGSGYQLTQALIAFGRGELFGLGLGEGVQKLFYLPEAHNDFIFAVVGEELGLLGAVVLIGLLGFLVLRILRIGRQALNEGLLFPGYLSYAIGILLGTQLLINLGVNTGVLPTKGLTLPFVSYGGNSLLVCTIMLALVIRTQIEMGAERG